MNSSITTHGNQSLLTPEQTSLILGVTVGTLAVWRSVGRHNLPYAKYCGNVRYRSSDIQKFIEKSIRTHTGE